MVITFLNQKGGVGKSTIAYSLACTLKAAKLDVSVRDLDLSQRSLTNAVNRTKELPFAGDPASAIIVQDTPGHLDYENEASRKEVQAIIQSSTRIVIVSELSLPSIEASARSIAFVKSCIPATAKAFILWNKVRVNTESGKQDKDALAESIGLPALKNWLPLASCYEDTLALGYEQILADRSKERKLMEALAMEILAGGASSK
jgi:chromosome partitioning protein